jgi:hypothetical protein
MWIGLFNFGFASLATSAFDDLDVIYNATQDVNDTIIPMHDEITGFKSTMIKQYDGPLFTD